MSLLLLDLTAVGRLVLMLKLKVETEKVTFHEEK